ncbi:MAG: leucyl aminopeptidase family protein [Pseudomonadota bacterium]
MIDFSHLIAADTGQSATPITCLTASQFDGWLRQQSDAVRAFVKASGFAAKPHEYVLAPDGNGETLRVVAGVADSEALAVWSLARLADILPEGYYRLDDEVTPGQAVIGWCLAQHRFDRYLSNGSATDKGPRILLTDKLPDSEARLAEAGATALVRDMVNTPAEDMGPAELERLAEKAAKAYDAELTVTRGDALEQGYPMIHAVGRAASRQHAPRLIELRWGSEDHPRLAIVGKGVCFDSGGLDIKTAIGMRLMKKDMGGAAHALALAHLVMVAKLPVRMHMLIPAVENGIAAGAFRPGDILTSRKGDSVEIGNTDAEGRLVLGDALTKAGEDTPELVIDFATLTGAARIALGPDLPAMFCDNDDVAGALHKAGCAVGDPLWRLPLWDDYGDMLKSPVADVNNSGGAFAGSITAALFLKRFAPDNVDWVHFDTFAWRPTARPGQAVGGEALGLRASWHYLQQRFG